MSSGDRDDRDVGPPPEPEKDLGSIGRKDPSGHGACKVRGSPQELRETGGRIWTVMDVLRWTIGRFERAGIPSARLDAEVLLARVLGCDRVRLYMDHERPLTQAERAAYRDLVRRRASGEPAAYLLGEKEFYGRTFVVDPRVLVPRPETEHVVDAALQTLRVREEITSEIRGRRCAAAARCEERGVAIATRATSNEVRRGCSGGRNPEVILSRALSGETGGGEHGRLEEEREDRGRGDAAQVKVLDLCTGSGCIAVTLAAEVPELSVVAVDISPGACAVARENATRLGVADRVQVLQGDLFEPVRVAGLGPFHLIVANPPYVSSGEMGGLMRDVREHEPGEALVSGPTGLEILQRIIVEAPEHSRPGGHLILEHGEEQGLRLLEIIEADPHYEEVRDLRDHAGFGRVVMARARTAG